MAGILARFARDESAATAVEYGLIAALVVLTAMTAITLFAEEVNALIDYVSTSFLEAV
jgi:pilus assembly protein Flp/PilA